MQLHSICMITYSSLKQETHTFATANKKEDNENNALTFVVVCWIFNKNTNTIQDVCCQSTHTYCTCFFKHITLHLKKKKKRPNLAKGQT